MTLTKRSDILQKAYDMAMDIFRTGGKNEETALMLTRNLIKYGENLVERIEREKGIKHKIDCKIGCSFCCYSRISLTPAEAVLISHFIKENYSLQKTDALLKRATNNLRLTQDKSEEERINLWGKTPCIFLHDDTCSIYDVRPFICRAWHSLSADQCSVAFHTSDKDAEIDTTPFRNIILGAVRDGLSHACEAFNCETQPIELTSSIKIILNHPEPVLAWINGEPLFHSRVD